MSLLPVPDSGASSSLLESVLMLTSDLELNPALQKFVEAARSVTEAKYSALGILDSRGDTVAFHYSGIDEATAQVLGHPPRTQGVFELIEPDRPLIINDLKSHPHFVGWPEAHPDMKSFLGVPVTIREQVFGRLYLADKPGGFSETDAANMEILAAAAAVAVQNARTYSESQRRARWIGVSQQVTTALLEGTDEEEALELIAHLMREVSNSAAALIILPGIGDSWVCEFADGENTSHLLGLEFPPEGRARTVIREGTGLVVDSMTRLRTMRVAELRQYGPALYAPMIVHGDGVGVIVLLREQGGSEFDLTDLIMAESVAKQAALALELTAARHAKNVAAQIDERAQIGRDLHDLAIQQLFATGMQITRIRNDLAEKDTDGAILDLLNQALSSVDESVTEIRHIVHRLREPDATIMVVERLRREASLARTSLSFAPSLVISLNGEDLPGDADGETISRIDNIIGADIADDVVAVTREGLSNAARHAKASSVSVHVEVSRSRVTVTVTDDGIGPVPSVTRRSGTANLAARARRHGGTFELVRGNDQGAVMTWSVPLV